MTSRLVKIPELSTCQLTPQNELITNYNNIDTHNNRWAVGFQKMYHSSLYHEE